MTNIEKLTALGQLDFSHRITTEFNHCAELFLLVNALQPKSILEIGAGYGQSGLAIGLAAPDVTPLMVDIEEMPREIPESVWRSYGVHKVYVKDEAGHFLLGNGDITPLFDFIFHDAEHGPTKIPEYRRCWEMTKMAMAFHDAEMIDYQAFVKSLPDVLYASYSLDARGRALGCIVRKH